MQPTKRAFLFVKESVGWIRSPIGVIHAKEAIPEEDCPQEQLQLFDEDWCSRRLWNHSLYQVPLGDQASVEQDADSWARFWQENCLYNAHVVDEECPPPAALQVALIRSAAMSFPIRTGLGGYNIAPRALARLSDGLLMWLIMVSAAAEKFGEWPAGLNLVMIALIPKSDKGRRPIGLFPTLIRIWRISWQVAATGRLPWQSQPCFFFDVRAWVLNERLGFSLTGRRRQPEIECSSGRLCLPWSKPLKKYHTII